MHRPTIGKDNTALLFGSVETFFAVMFGPAQHDAHVECWRGDKWLTSREAHAAAANLRCGALVDEIAEQRAQEIAETHRFSVLDLRAELYRWETGFMKGDRFAPFRIRQIRRALEIAGERRAMAEAAE